MPCLRRIPLCGVLTVLMLTAGVSAQQQDHRFVAGRRSAELPFQLTSNKIYLPVRINGSKPLWFAADTGASHTVIDMDTARALGLNVAVTDRASGAGEARPAAGKVRVHSIELPGVTYSPGTIMAIRMGPVIDRFEGRRMDGLLGSDFFERFVVDVDYPARRLRIMEPDDFSYQGPGAVIPIEEHDGLIFAHGSVQPRGGQPLEGLFMIDSGARVAMTLNTPFVRVHRLLQTAGPTLVATVGGGIGGEVRHRVCRLEALHLGSLTVAGPVATLSQDRTSIFAERDFQGLVGADILRHFRVIFDYPHGRMIVERTPASTEPIGFDASGLFLVAEPPDFKTIRVLSVIPGSPAARAGIVRDDVVESIDRRSDLTLERARRLLRTAGAVRTLVIRQGDTRRTVPLKLVPLI